MSAKCHKQTSDALAAPLERGHEILLRIHRDIVSLLIPVVSVGSLVSLALLRFLSARIGGAGTLMPVMRVTFWDALAMALTAGIARFGHCRLRVTEAT